jgi:hypothetical protein
MSMIVAWFYAKINKSISVGLNGPIFTDPHRRTHALIKLYVCVEKKAVA